MHRAVMPRIDPGMQTGFVVQWLKKEGDHVEQGEAIAIGEGEKTTFDIVAPASGILRRQLYPPKSEVPVTEVIAFIGEADEEIPAHLDAPKAEQSTPTATVQREAPERGDELTASPVARRLARERNVDLSKIKGTGPGGRITREDVLNSSSTPSSAISDVTLEQSPSPIRLEEKLSTTRKTIAERLSYSQHTTASASIMMDIGMEAAIRLKQSMDSSGNRVSLTAMIVKAIAKSLAEDSTFNSSLEGEILRIYSDVNVAVAVQAPEALVAPVIPNADQKPLEAITEAIRLLTEKAQAHTLSISELTGSTVTVSNLGPQDVDVFIPIINPPNAIILGIGRISRRPTVIGDEIVPSPISTFTLVFDHRIGDGVAAAKLLAEVKHLMEEPQFLMG